MIQSLFFLCSTMAPTLQLTPQWNRKSDCKYLKTHVSGEVDWSYCDSLPEHGYKGGCILLRFCYARPLIFKVSSIYVRSTGCLMEPPGIQDIFKDISFRVQNLHLKYMLPMYLLSLGWEFQSLINFNFNIFFIFEIFTFPEILLKLVIN